MKLNVTVHRDDNYFPRLIEIKRGRRAKVTVEQTPSAKGEVYSIEIEGKQDRLPSFTEVLAMVNARRLDRIGTIDELTLLRVLEELTVIKNIENIENMPNVSLVGSSGVGFRQVAAGSSSSDSPTSHSDPEGAWAGETKIYDGNTGTYGNVVMISHMWTPFIYLIISARFCNKVRAWLKSQRPSYANLIDVDVMKFGAWLNVYEGVYGEGAFVEFPFSEGNVSQMRIRFYNASPYPQWFWIYEADFGAVPTTGGEIITHRQDITSLGLTASPNAAGIKIITGIVGKQVKIFDAGYLIAAAGLHYFYFGTTTTPTNKIFLSALGEGTYHQTFVHPRLGDVGDSLYIYSAVAETNMPYDLGYVLE